MLLYTLAAWIALSRVLIGQHYVTDVVLGAILGTVFPYFVRDRFAARRWLFERTPEGGYRLRGARTQRWLGWPPSKETRSADLRAGNRRGLTLRPTPGGRQIARKRGGKYPYREECRALAERPSGPSHLL